MNRHSNGTPKSAHTGFYTQRRVAKSGTLENPNSPPTRSPECGYSRAGDKLGVSPLSSGYQVLLSCQGLRDQPGASSSRAALPSRSPPPLTSTGARSLPTSHVLPNSAEAGGKVSPPQPLPEQAVGLLRSLSVKGQPSVKGEAAPSPGPEARPLHKAPVRRKALASTSTPQC